MESRTDIPAIVWNEMNNKILNESFVDLPFMQQAKLWQEKTGLGYICTKSKDKNMVSVIITDERKFFLSKINYGF
jgi:hypothetical protein